MIITKKTAVAFLVAADLGVLCGSAAAADAFPRGSSAGPLVAAPARHLSESCPNGAKIVHCLNGTAMEDAKFEEETVETCAEACGGLCCEGSYACDGGKFSVCADDSCVGDDACYGLDLSVEGSGIAGLVAGGSCDGTDACYFAGVNGTVGNITGDSCVGSSSCKYAGAYGHVGNITGGSCDGQEACQLAGAGGHVGDITGGSCKGKEACTRAGAEGTVGDITGGSCVGFKACDWVGNKGGHVGDISDSCQGYSACENLGYSNGDFGSSLESCCNGYAACDNTGCTSYGSPMNCEYQKPFPSTCSPSDAPTASPSTLSSPTGCAARGRFEFSCDEEQKKGRCAKQLLCKWEKESQKCVHVCATNSEKTCRKIRFKNNKVCTLN